MAEQTTFTGPVAQPKKNNTGKVLEIPFAGALIGYLFYSGRISANPSNSAKGMYELFLIAPAGAYAYLRIKTKGSG